MQSEEHLLGPDHQSASSEERNHDWAAGLIKAVEDSRIVLGEFRLEEIVPGQPSDQIREAVDINYEVWLPASGRTPSQSARVPRSREPREARGKRRAQLREASHCIEHKVRLLCLSS